MAGAERESRFETRIEDDDENEERGNAKWDDERA
jgi:hypothetical protein